MRVTQSTAAGQGSQAAKSLQDRRDDQSTSCRRSTMPPDFFQGQSIPPPGVAGRTSDRDADASPAPIAPAEV